MRTRHLGPAAVGTVLVVGTLVGCSQAEVVCPAIAYGARLDVRLTDAWPDREHLALDVWCTDRDAEWCQVVPAGAVPAAARRAPRSSFRRPEAGQAGAVAASRAAEGRSAQTVSR